jgi:hypothetical protein
MKYEANLGMVESPSKSCGVVVVSDVSFMLPLVLFIVNVKLTYLLCNRSQKNGIYHPGIVV